MPAKDKDPTSPKSPAKSRAKAKPKAETPATPATPVAPKQAAARSRSKRPVTEPVLADATAPDALAAPKRRRAPKRAAAVTADTSAPASQISAPGELGSLESPPIDALPASTSEIFSDVSSSREAQIRLRAYLIYAERGHRPGSPESDWYQAEQEVAYGRRV
jgi:hypothetical protein